MFNLSTPPCTEARPASKWLRRHTDLYHEGSRETCDHCQLMIHYYGPMPSQDELRAAERKASRQEKPAYQKAPIPEDIRWAVWERNNFTCGKCGTRRNLTIDHIIPEVRGGATTPDNLTTLCRSCNSRKGARDA